MDSYGNEKNLDPPFRFRVTCHPDDEALFRESMGQVPAYDNIEFVTREDIPPGEWIMERVD